MINHADYQYITGFLEKNQSEQIFLDAAFEGCSLAEIAAVENALNYTLPLAIKEFLRFCGKRWKGTYVLKSVYDVITNTTVYDTFKETIKSTRDEELREVDINNVVIIESDDHIKDNEYVSFFYKTDVNPDPLIYSVEDGKFVKATEKEKYPLSFTALLTERFKVGKYYDADNFIINSLAKLYSRLAYINPNAIKRLSLTSPEIIAELSDLILKLPQIEEISCRPYNSDLYSKHKISFQIPFVYSLKIITISQHELVSVKFPAEGLPNLQELSIDSENFDGTLDNISHCKQLEKLYLHSGNYHSFPLEIFEVGNLKELSIGKLSMSQIPEGLSKLSQLKTIVLKGYIQVFPEELFGINSLEVIDLSGNIISQIDERIKQLKNLKILDISRNCFSTEAIEHIKTLIPELEIRDYYSQKPPTKKEGNIKNNFRIDVNDDIREKYFKLLQENELYYMPGTDCIFTNKLYYDACLKTLEELLSPKLNDLSHLQLMVDEHVYEKYLQILENKKIKHSTYSNNRILTFTHTHDYERSIKLLNELIYPSRIEVMINKISKLLRFGNGD